MLERHSGKRLNVCDGKSLPEAVAGANWGKTFKNHESYEFDESGRILVVFARIRSIRVIRGFFFPDLVLVKNVETRRLGQK